MPGTPGTDESSLREEASAAATRWVVALQDAPADAGLAERFEKWRSANSANAEAWARTIRLFNSLGGIAPAHRDFWEVIPASPKDPRGITGPRSSYSQADAGGRRRRAVVGGVAVAIAASICLVVLPGMIQSLSADYSTRTAEIRNVELSDGSVVRLAPETMIRLAFGRERRGVELVSGTAYFEVTPGQARPFQVQAGDMTATVLGTKFAVDAARANVAVKEGRVRVERRDHAGSGREVGAGEVAHLRTDGQIVLDALPVEQIAAWQYDQLIAQDRSVADVLGDIKPFYKGLLIVADAALAEKRISGVYNLTDPVRAVRGMAAAHGLLVRQVTPWVTIVSEGDPRK